MEMVRGPPKHCRNQKSFWIPQADAWRVGLILFLKKLFLWYTLLSIDSTQSEINDSGLACRKSDF